MNQSVIWAYLFLCIVLANLPWLSERFLLLKSLTRAKSLWLTLVEWLFYAGVALVAGWALEWQLTGDVKDQDWEFFVSVLFMFAIMSFPGLVWRQQKRKQAGETSTNLS